MDKQLNKTVDKYVNKIGQKAFSYVASKKPIKDENFHRFSATRMPIRGVRGKKPSIEL
jgi:hypothetical protein